MTPSGSRDTASQSGAPPAGQPPAHPMAATSEHAAEGEPRRPPDRQGERSEHRVERAGPAAHRPGFLDVGAFPEIKLPDEAAGLCPGWMAGR